MGDQDASYHLIRVTRPALLLAPTTFLVDSRARLEAAGVIEAVARRDGAPIFDFVAGLIGLQGISDAAAFAFSDRHGNITHAEIEAALVDRPACPLLRSYWSFDCCGYRKSSASCNQPRHLPTCPLPVHPLRKGSLNQAAYSLFFFIRDICGGDLVGWIDARLCVTDWGTGAARAARMRASLLEPLGHVFGIGNKLWSMILSELLLVGDPDRERWVATGASMMAVDSIVHAFLHRTGALKRFGAPHPYGLACYAPGGCAELIEGLAARVDAREFNAVFPAYFPRFIEVAIWGFCAGWGRNICNGNQIDDRFRCTQTVCPTYGNCDREPVRPDQDQER
jgi:hypothetical protein